MLLPRLPRFGISPAMMAGLFQLARPCCLLAMACALAVLGGAGCQSNLANVNQPGPLAQVLHL
jgi:hypothetical protein